MVPSLPLQTLLDLKLGRGAFSQCIYGEAMDIAYRLDETKVGDLLQRSSVACMIMQCDPVKLPSNKVRTYFELCIGRFCLTLSQLRNFADETEFSMLVMLERSHPEFRHVALAPPSTWSLTKLRSYTRYEQSDSQDQRGCGQ